MHSPEDTLYLIAVDAIHHKANGKQIINVNHKGPVEPRRWGMRHSTTTPTNNR